MTPFSVDGARGIHIARKQRIVGNRYGISNITGPASVVEAI